MNRRLPDRDLLAKSKQLIYFRFAFALITLSFALVLWNFAHLEISPLGFAAACSLVVLVNLAGLFVIINNPGLRNKPTDYLNAVLLFSDIVALSLIVHFSHGIESDLFFLYLLPIMLASNIYKRPGIYLTAFAVSSAYLGVLLLENWSFVPYLAKTADQEGLTAAYAQRLFGQIVSRSGILFVLSIIWAAFCVRMSGLAQESTTRLAEQLKTNTELLDELKKQTQRESLSNEIGLALRKTLDLDQILSTTCSRLSEALSEKHCVFITGMAAGDSGSRMWDSALIAGHEHPIVGNAQLQDFFIEHTWKRDDKSNTGAFNKIIISERPFSEPDFDDVRSELLKLDLSMLLVRPIMYRSSLQGVLAIFSSGEKHNWTAQELELVDSIAGRLAIAIEHAKLIEQLSESNRSLVQKNANLDAKNLELRQVQSQLIHQEKMASLGRIVAGIAHELNNPINFVHGNLPYLREYFEDLKKLIANLDELPKESQTKVQELKKKINYDFMIADLDNIIADLSEGAERVRQIIMNLRSFSRLDEAELKEASIQEGIESTIKILSQYYGNDKITVKTSFAKLPAVLCYPGKLNQVWMNLLSNAAQAVSTKEDPRVTISTQLEDDWVTIAIEDNGAGIKASEQSKVFEPFFTTKPVGQGTGLGLSICHSIIERHGGRIWFESSPNSGTKFLVRIPVRAIADHSEGSSISHRDPDVELLADDLTIGREQG